MRASWGSVVRDRVSQMPTLPRVLTTTGAVLVLLGITQVGVTFRGGGSLLEICIDFILIGTPGFALVYTGAWMPVSEIERPYYPRVFAWLFGGVVVMYGFIVLRDLHPGVTVEWSLGTQAIALTIGSIGGLLIGIQETRATMQTEQLERQTRQLEEYTDQLEQRERELKRQNDQLNEFASIVSHDLRNPLNVASGRLELLREECESEQIEGIDDALTRMDDLIEDLLALARDGEHVRERQSIELGAFVETCWENVATAEATLISHTDRTISADRGRLKQVMENLIRNSIDHGGSDVTVTVGDLADGFYVEDDGPGIPEDDRESVFKSGYSRSDGGTGFGLHIVRQVVDAHGWEIHTTEGTDGGARFEITGVESG